MQIKRRYCFMLALALLAAIAPGIYAAVKVTTPPSELKLDPFYQKYLNCDGIPVVSSDKVDDRAFYRLKYLLDSILANRPDIRSALQETDYRCIIIAHNEQVTEIPEYSYMEPVDFWNQRARGFGGPTTSCGEENLLCLPQDRYKESIFIHELAHSIHSPGLTNCDKAFQQKLEKLYKEAMEKGLYKDDYAATNESEYWAESVQAYFDCDSENNHVHNHVNTREELFEYDRPIAQLIEEVFGFTAENDWRYQPLSPNQPVEQISTVEIANQSFNKYNWHLGFNIYAQSDINDSIISDSSALIHEVFADRYDILKDISLAEIPLVIITDKTDSSFSFSASKLPVDTKQYHKVITLTAGNAPSLSLELKRQLLSNIALAVYNTVLFRDELNDSTKLKPYQEKVDYLSKTIDARIASSYKKESSQNIWQDSIGVKNRFEYFSYGMSAYFNAGPKSMATREQLENKSPELHGIIKDIFTK